jgi:pimeloyl-ACP methyl ester carboxylesterase
VLNHEDVVVNGIRLHCVVAGRGTLILFLHGFPEFWYQWRKQFDEFANEYLVVAPDMRGYNLSDKPPDVDQYKLTCLVEDIRGLAEHFSRNRKFILVGHDWGGFVSWAFGSAYPAYIDKLVIINAPHPILFERLLSLDEAQRTASQYIPKLRSKGAELKLSADGFAAMGNLLFRTSTFTRDDEAEYIRAWSRPGSLTGALNYYRANRLGDLPSTTDCEAVWMETEITKANGAQSLLLCPTLVIWGELDTALIMRNVDELGQFVPQLTIRRIPDGSHWVVHEKPKEVNAYIRAFIQS